jgi:hypothetical protein
MDHTDVVQQLRDLSELHAAGVLGDEEFARAKRLVIESSGPGPMNPPAAAAMSEEHSDPPTVPAPRYALESNALVSREPSTHDRETTPVPDPPAIPPSDAPLHTGPAERADTDRIPRQPAASHAGEGAAPAAPWGPRGPAPQARPRAQHVGAIVAAIMAAVAGISFLALPMVSVPVLGSASGTRLASLASQPGAGGFAELWLIPIAAVVILGLAARQLLDPPLSAGGRRVTLIPLIALATATALAYVVLLIAVQELLAGSGASKFGSSAIDFAGVGFWLTLVGMIAAAISGGVELSVNWRLPDTATSRSAPATSPPRRVWPSRNIALTLGAAGVALAMVGIAIWNVKNQPVPLAQDVSALQGSSPSSRDGQNNTPNTGGSQAPSSSVPGVSSPVAATTFVRNYYGLLPDNPDAAWTLLSPEAQAASGGHQSYDKFWREIASVSLGNVRTTGPGTIEADLHFTRVDGSTTTEHYRTFVSDSGGHQVIQAFSRLAVTGSSPGSSSGQPSVVGIVDLSAVSSDSRAPEIGAVLNGYFSGINQQDWSRAMSVLDPQVVDSSDPNQVAGFEHDLSTTNESNVVVKSIHSTSDAPSGISAMVTFQSNQNPSLGPNGQSCTLWNLEYLFSGDERTSFLIYKTRGSHASC